jgi:hypothetical protein
MRHIGGLCPDHGQSFHNPVREESPTTRDSDDFALHYGVVRDPCLSKKHHVSHFGGVSPVLTKRCGMKNRIRTAARTSSPAST